MDLSNIIAHIMVDTKKKDNEVTELENHDINISEFVHSLYEIKDFCITELINCKENGEALEIQLTNDENGERKFDAVIPQYFEPFSVHCGAIEFTEEQLNKYRPKSRELLKCKKIMPFKVLPEKQEILEYIYRNRNDRELRQIKDRIEWYFDAQERLKEIREKQEIENQKKITDLQPENQEKANLQKIKELDGSIKEKQEVKNDLKNTIKAISSVSDSLKGEIKQNKRQIRQLEDEFTHTSEEEEQKIVEKIIYLRELVEEQKSKRRELKEKRGILKNRAKELKAKVKLERADLSEAIEDIEL